MTDPCPECRPGYPRWNGVTLIHSHTDPEYDGFRITELWAYTQIDQDNEEGILTLSTPKGPMPLIASDRVRLRDLRMYARMVAKQSRRPVRLRRFTVAEDVETFEP